MHLNDHQDCVAIEEQLANDVGVHQQSAEVAQRSQDVKEQELQAAVEEVVTLKKEITTLQGEHETLNAQTKQLKKQCEEVTGEKELFSKKVSELEPQVCVCGRLARAHPLLCEREDGDEKREERSERR